MVDRQIDATYLQAFYFSLEAKDEVFHVAAVEALLPLLFWCRRAFNAGFLVVDG